MESANTKTFLILQAHFSRLQLPCSDYYTDTKSVLDQTIRILQGTIHILHKQAQFGAVLTPSTLLCKHLFCTDNKQ
jgi:activating signal cointegrator complex subunit 3